MGLLDLPCAFVYFSKFSAYNALHQFILNILFGFCFWFCLFILQSRYIKVSTSSNLKTLLEPSVNSLLISVYFYYNLFFVFISSLLFLASNIIFNYIFNYIKLLFLTRHKNSTLQVNQINHWIIMGIIFKSGYHIK